MSRSSAAVRVTVAAAVMTLFAAGCGSDASDADETEDVPSPTAVTLPVSDATTTLLDAGAQPRGILAPIASPDEQSAVLTTSSSILQSIDDQPPQDFSTPPVTTPLTATSAPSRTEGGIEVSMILGQSTTPDATLSGNLAATEGSEAGWTLTPAGAVTALIIDPSPDASDIARAAVEQALSQAVYRVIPFPGEPVGEGAQWTVTQEVVSGIALTQETTVTLTSIEDGVATLDLAVSQSAQQPIWQLPDGEGSLNIEAFDLSGTGSVTVDLDRPLPVAGSITVGGDQVYRDPNSETVLRQTTTNSVEWSS